MSNRRRTKPITPERAAAIVEANPESDPASAVAVGFVHTDHVDYSFFHSFTQLLGYDAGRDGRVWRGGFVSRRGTTGDLAAGRNGVVTDFLADGKAGWLWWVDTDMGYEPDTIDRLLEVADPVHRPVVGALCFAQRENEPDGVGGWRPVAWPVLMDWTVVDGRGGFEVRWDYPRDTVTRCHGTGSACVLIHRGVFEQVRDDYERIQREQGIRKDGDPRWDMWYSRVTNPTTGELVGEDLSFCMRLMRLEIPVFVHTGVRTTHTKQIWLQEEDYWRQRALNPPPETATPVPAEQRAAPRYAVVPTRNRPGHLLSLVASLAEQTDHIVVLDNGCDPPVDVETLQQAAGKASVKVLLDPEQPPNLARFWNLLFDQCQGEIRDVAVFNDDAVVPAGWFDVVSAALRQHRTAAVAHTGTVSVHRPELLDVIPYPRHKRMCPWAFVVKGELGLRADESMRWWFFDDDFCRQAIQAGGVLAVPGPLVSNALANSTTNGVLMEQAQRDQVTFAAKWQS